MQNVNFYTGSRVIFNIINTELDSNSSRHKLEELLQNSAGGDVQSILVKTGIGLDRLNTTRSMVNGLNRMIYEYNFNGFKVVSSDGNYKNARKVLHDRLYGEEGILSMFTNELENILANAKHISKENNVNIEEYWLKSIKSYKYKLFAELDGYFDLVITIIEKALDNFNTINSEIMNMLLKSKEEAENQQSVLIKLNTFEQPIPLQESSIIDRELLFEFLIEANVGANFIIFTKRLNSIIERTAPLKLFSNPYDNLSHASGTSWTKLKSVKHAAVVEGEKAINDCKQLVSQRLDLVDYKSSEYVFELEPYARNLVDLFESKVDLLINYSLEWISSVKSSRQYILDVSS